jgi:hypothetical protein
MTDLVELITDCDTRGIQLLAASDDALIIDAPQNALTPALMGQLKAYKREILAMLRGRSDAVPLMDDSPPSHANGSNPGDVIIWEDAIAPPLPCPECKSLELWQNPLGVWRCIKCDPPTVASSLLKWAKRLRDGKLASQSPASRVLANLRMR